MINFICGFTALIFVCMAHPSQAQPQRPDDIPTPLLSAGHGKPIDYSRHTASPPFTGLGHGRLIGSRAPCARRPGTPLSVGIFIPGSGVVPGHRSK